MKKIAAVLMTLCLLCTALPALADMEIPVFENMPGVVIEDENTTVDEKAFEGEWVLNVAFLGTEYISESDLAEQFGFNFMPIRIEGRKIMQDIQDENGEFHTAEMECAFEAGELQGVDGTGIQFVIDLLEDSNIVLSVFLPGEGDEVQCLSCFLMHPAE